MKTTDAIEGNEMMILEHYGINPSKKHTTCPLCEGKAKFRISHYQGKVMYICTCSQGSILDLIISFTRRTFQEVVQEIDKLLGNVFEPTVKYAKEKTKQLEKKKWQLDYLRTLTSIHDTPGQAYLRKRGIYAAVGSGVGWDQKQSCIVAYSKSSLTNQISHIHQTFIKNIDGNWIKDFRPTKEGALIDKKMVTVTDFVKSPAVQLFRHSDILGIAEGLETALSAHEMYKLPMWAALNASLLSGFIAPSGVKVLRIYADNDANGTGMAAAYKAGRANILSKRINDVQTVEIYRPQQRGDFNDVLCLAQKVVLVDTLSR